MIAYHRYLELCGSADSDDRGQAAHLAAMAFLEHDGPADEQAALYAALINFLDDSSVKVRAALAYGLLHSPQAPRPVIVSLLHDAPVIARAVAQYSPVLIDADLLGVVRQGPSDMRWAISMRETVSPRLAEALVACGEKPLTLRLLQRSDITLSSATLVALTEVYGQDPVLRGALLARDDLPAASRLALVEIVTQALRQARIVKGAIAAPRLERLLREAGDTAVTGIGEKTRDPDYAADLVARGRISLRMLLHAVVNGHVLFFAACLSELAEMPSEKVFSILNSGGRPALNALLSRCGLTEGVRNALARLIGHARTADLGDDCAARHFAVTALTQELLLDHGGTIPPDLEDVFAYLNEQNIILARRAARGVMAGFVERSPSAALPAGPEAAMRRLPAA